MTQNLVPSMPSKREILGKNSPSDGPNRSGFQWDRILAFVSGVGITVLYFWMNPFHNLPGWTAAALASIPVGLLLYSISTQSWQTCAKITIGTAIGIGLGTYL